MEKAVVTILNRITENPRTHIAHTVCTMRQPGPLADDLHGSIRLESLAIRGRDRLAALKLSKLMDRVRPTVVHARNFNTWLDCLLACRLSSKPRPTAVLGFHGLETAEGLPLRRKLLSHWIRRAATHFTTVSQSGAEQLRGDFGVPQENITILHNGVDTEQFSPADESARRAIRADLAIPEDRCVILMVGALVPVKDHHTAIEALKIAAPNIGQTELLIVGDGPLREDLNARASELPTNIRTRFLGVRHDVADLLRASDLFMTTSRYEQMSNALLEAMSTGLPAIATNVGDNALLVEHQRTGLIVPPADAQSLADAVTELADSPRNRRTFAESSRRKAVAQFDIDATADRYRVYYEQLINGMRSAEEQSSRSSRSFQREGATS